MRLSLFNPALRGAAGLCYHTAQASKAAMGGESGLTVVLSPTYIAEF